MKLNDNKSVKAFLEYCLISIPLHFVEPFSENAPKIPTIDIPVNMSKKTQ